jgi:predicted ABC-type transport system involved in lysophospholipase L1 biosynthesis ATPase subunit
VRRWGRQNADRWMLAFEELQMRARTWLRSQAGRKGTGISVEAFHRYCNVVLLPECLTQEEIAEHLSSKTNKEEIISRSTAAKWMKQLGFSNKLNRKSTYLDGHENEPVVDYRQDVFLPLFLFVNEYALQYDGKDNEKPSIQSDKFKKDLDELCARATTMNAMVKSGLDKVLRWQGNLTVSDR